MLITYKWIKKRNLKIFLFLLQFINKNTQILNVIMHLWRTNDKNIIYYIDIKNNSKNLDIEIISDDEEDSKMKISCFEWYDIDENYNYLLAGTTTSRIYLIDFNINGSYIITNFGKTGNSIKHYLG